VDDGEIHILGEIGDIIDGRYRLIEEIGRGGYGTVYRAHQVSMNRDVAVKLIHIHLAHAPGVIPRFIREARLAARLSHPNILVCYDFGQFQERLYLVTEFVPGYSLSHILKEKGGVDQGTACHIGMQICSALETAHEQNVIHRDLKPSNILLTRRAGDKHFVKVIDFGLARIIHEHPRGITDELTASDVLIGTPAYMAPEQIQGRELDARSDLYSLGVLLYVSIIGELPFQGGTTIETVVQHLTQPVPDMLEKRSGLSEELVSLIRHCLEKAPEQRPSSAGEVYARLGSAKDRFYQDVIGLSSSAQKTLHYNRKSDPYKSSKWRLSLLFFLGFVMLSCVIFWSIFESRIESGLVIDSTQPGGSLNSPSDDRSEAVPMGLTFSDAITTVEQLMNDSVEAAHVAVSQEEVSVYQGGDERDTPVSVRQMSRLRINAEPWALVSCNGVDYGETPIDVAVREGRYRCLLSGPSGQVVERELGVGEDTAEAPILVRFREQGFQ
jgi:serine/threonine protein kinase